MRSIYVSLSALLLLMGAACSDGDDDGTTEADAGNISGAADASASEADAGATSPLEFMSMCEVDNDQCDMANEEFCFAFNSRGPHCTRSCSSPDDCEAPSSGCNNMGVCKAPNG